MSCLSRNALVSAYSHSRRPWSIVAGGACGTRRSLVRCVASRAIGSSDCRTRSGASLESGDVMCCVMGEGPEGDGAHDGAAARADSAAASSSSLNSRTRIVRGRAARHLIREAPAATQPGKNSVTEERPLRQCAGAWLRYYLRHPHKKRGAGARRAAPDSRRRAGETRRQVGQRHRLQHPAAPRPTSSPPPPSAARSTPPVDVRKQGICCWRGHRRGSRCACRTSLRVPLVPTHPASPPPACVAPFQTSPRSRSTSVMVDLCPIT